MSASEMRITVLSMELQRKAVPGFAGRFVTDSTGLSQAVINF